ncbi:hypothetical protein HCTV-8_gp38 [Haloarcula virus HCTV-8]|nr:hypothetical protein HRTV-16_gp38 [Halorubrum virus HRTV-16]UBF20937.1 hypothetical protein HCTV-8_gp38 [Haloarcula virus HCTV-8]UBF21049.1 hypothetical protein HCTV-10_gp38 [Haloarcula virus HCTV-10]
MSNPQITEEMVNEALSKEGDGGDVSEKTAVYFDQKVWGSFVEEDSNVDSDDFLELTEKSVNEADFIYPLSIENLIETVSHPEREFTEEVYEIMMELSQNHTLRYLDSVLDYEAINYICSRHPLMLSLDMKSVVIGKGLANVGGDWTIKPEEKVDEEMAELFKRGIEDDDINREILLSDEMIEDAPGVTPEEKEQYTEQYRAAMRENDAEIDFNDDTDRSLYITEVFERRILTRLQHYCEQLGFDCRRLILETFNPNSFEQSFSQFPTFYTESNLSFSTESLSKREPEFNDILDITSLSVAAPYCDIVVGEQFFTGMLHRYDVGEKYDTKIFSSVVEFRDWLNDELD